MLRAAADYVEQHRQRQQAQPLRGYRAQVTDRPTTRRDGIRVWRVRHRDLLSDRSRAELTALLREV